jgi:ribonuclease D
MVVMVEGDFPVEWIHGARAAGRIGMDIETSGLSPVNDQIATIQMFVPNMGTVMVRKLNAPINLLRLLEDRQTCKIFHHAPFDLGFIQRKFDVTPRSISCTKIAAKMVDPQRLKFFDPDTNKGSHSLKSIVWTMFQEKLDKTLAVSDWFADDLSEAQLAYAAKDVEYLPEILRRLEVDLSRLRVLTLFRKTSNYIPTKIELELKKFDSIYEY